MLFVLRETEGLAADRNLTKEKPMKYSPKLAMIVTTLILSANAQALSINFVNADGKKVGERATVSNISLTKETQMIDLQTNFVLSQPGDLGIPGNETIAYAHCYIDSNAAKTILEMSKKELFSLLTQASYLSNLSNGTDTVVTCKLGAGPVAHSRNQGENSINIFGRADALEISTGSALKVRY